MNEKQWPRQRTERVRHLRQCVQDVMQKCLSRVVGLLILLFSLGLWSILSLSLYLLSNHQQREREREENELCHVGQNGIGLVLLDRQTEREWRVVDDVQMMVKCRHNRVDRLVTVNSPVHFLSVYVLIEKVHVEEEEEREERRKRTVRSCSIVVSHTSLPTSTKREANWVEARTCLSACMRDNGSSDS